jgi:hypothetical protein
MGRFADFFLERVNYWVGVLSTVESTLRLWLLVQRRWMAMVRQ